METDVSRLPRASTVNWRAGLCRLAFMLALAGLLGCDAREPAWNVLLVTFDTTRADHLGCYGHPRASTPHADGLAAEGVLFRQAYSSLPLTLPSHSTIFTGLYPPAHGVRDNGLFVLADEQTTLAERLSSVGYKTGAAIGGFPLETQFGIGQGFQFFDDHLTGDYEDFRGEKVRPKTRIYFDERPAARVNEAIFPWLTENSDQPFFAWVHYYDPHQPQEPPSPYDQLFADDPYLGEIAYADENLGNLLRHLEGTGALDRTIVVLTADHGEGLGEHRELTHAYLLYDSTLHVPLIIRLPPAHPLHGKTQEVESRVSSVDILPTVLDLVGLERPDGLHGRSMVGLLNGELQDHRPHYAETLSPRFNNDWGELRALYDGHWKYIHGPKPELFDLETPNPETDNLVAARPKIAEEMRGKLSTLIHRRAASASASAVMPDSETRKRLEALGYLQGGGSLQVQEELRDDGIAPQDRVDDISAISRIRQALFNDQARTAAEIAQRLVDEDPNNRYYLDLLAQAQAQLGDLESMLVTVDHLIELGATSGIAERLLLYAGQFLFFEGDKEGGLQRIERSMALRPTADGHYTASILFSADGESEKALDALRQALEIDPNHARARDDLAARLAEAGDREGAAAEFERLLAAHPYFPKAHYNFGVFVSETGDYANAASSFRRSLDLDPTYLEPYFGLVFVELQAGRPEAARQAFDELSAKAPNHRVTRRAQALLERAS